MRVALSRFKFRRGLELAIFWVLERITGISNDVAAA